MKELTIRPMYKDTEVEIPNVREHLVISPCIGIDFFLLL